MKIKKDFMYCDNRNCPKIECLRHNKNTPFDVLFVREHYEPDNKGNCKHYTD